MEGKRYHTLKGYQINDKNILTSSMEDYLEMILRMFKTAETIRITDLAKNLNVRPSSASKMANNLMELGFIDFKKYGSIILTEKGKAAGEYLLFRHNVVHGFLCVLNETENETEQTEKIEHFLNKKTIYNLKTLTEKMKSEWFKVNLK